jgi:hypothetical protein
VSFQVFQPSGVFGHYGLVCYRVSGPGAGTNYILSRNFSGSDSSPVVLSDGSCTNGTDGAFSGAALASQALSELSQTTTQVTTKELGKAIVERREQERERMRRPVPPARAVPREKPKPAAVVRKEPPPPPALLPIEPAVRFGTWAQVYGDYQERDASGPGILNCCTSSNIIGLNNKGLALNIESRASTVGFVAGADFTSWGLYSASDGFIAGVRRVKPACRLRCCSYLHILFLIHVQLTPR